MHAYFILNGNLICGNFHVRLIAVLLRLNSYESIFAGRLNLKWFNVSFEWFSVSINKWSFTARKFPLKRSTRRSSSRIFTVQTKMIYLEGGKWKYDHLFVCVSCYFLILFYRFFDFYKTFFSIKCFFFYKTFFLFKYK